MTRNTSWLSKSIRLVVFGAGATLVVLANGTGCGGSMPPPQMGGSSTGASSGSGASQANGDGGSSSGNLGGSDMGTEVPMEEEGWSDFTTLLIESDGTHAIGTPGRMGPSTDRDTGSKIIYFDAEGGDTEAGGIYFWEDGKIVDSEGSFTDEDGEEYGSDPFEPNLNAIKPWRNLANRAEYHSHGGSYDGLAGGFADWYLFRRGQSHTEFEVKLIGGQSPEAPMLVGAYGDPGDGRARMDPATGSPFRSSPNGKSPIYHHMVMVGLDIFGGWSTGAYGAGDQNPDGQGASAFVEDCAFTRGSGENANRILYPPRNTAVRRSLIGFSFDPENHNQGYYTAGELSQVSFEEVIFYRNGYKEDPRLNADPQRDVFSRNIYEGGGAAMGHSYKGIISADGASGGPQMRFGGLMENSLIIEGYWFSSTDSNSANTPWPDLQEGSSAVVKNNVQLAFRYPSPADPDPNSASDENAQVGDGFTLMASSFGSVIDGNIFSGALNVLELGGSDLQTAIAVNPGTDTYPDGNIYTMRDNTVSNNVLHRVSTGISIGQDWSNGATGMEVFGNVVSGRQGLRVTGNNGPTTEAQLTVHDNTFYVDEAPADGVWLGDGNETSSRDSAADSEGWSDPDRTLKRYVVEKLGLELLDWDDDPYLDPAQASARAGEEYDPMGLKTFMAVAMTMRRGGTVAVPTSGKPVVDADYSWDSAFTAPAVVSWIREGFGLPAVE